ncbi:hypothetical protein RZS08_56880, partial [Arthrospira platensis SPKY1]|nr:hypothetical protein [Arthrospira platensis SPKY1]
MRLWPARFPGVCALIVWRPQPGASRLHLRRNRDPQEALQDLADGVGEQAEDPAAQRPGRLVGGVHHGVF